MRKGSDRPAAATLIAPIPNARLVNIGFHLLPTNGHHLLRAQMRDQEETYDAIVDLYWSTELRTPKSRARCLPSCEYRSPDVLTDGYTERIS